MSGGIAPRPRQWQVVYADGHIGLYDADLYGRSHCEMVRSQCNRWPAMCRGGVVQVVPPAGYRTQLSLFEEASA